jgi:hypothetical protein
MSEILSEAATCPPWCHHHLDNAESGNRRHVTAERVFRAGNGVLVVGWSGISSTKMSRW